MPRQSSVYHQLAVALASLEKLAFQGPDAIKWTYMVMPFGPTNSPATFINFIYDVNSKLKALVTSSGVTINEESSSMASSVMAKTSTHP
jgi:hypothetical protein